MATPMQVEIVSPERVLFSGEADPFTVISGSLVSGIQQIVAEGLSEDEVSRLYQISSESVPV